MFGWCLSPRFLPGNEVGLALVVTPRGIAEPRVNGNKSPKPRLSSSLSPHASGSAGHTVRPARDVRAPRSAPGGNGHLLAVSLRRSLLPRLAEHALTPVADNINAGTCARSQSPQRGVNPLAPSSSEILSHVERGSQSSVPKLSVTLGVRERRGDGGWLRCLLVVLASRLLYCPQ